MDHLRRGCVSRRHWSWSLGDSLVWCVFNIACLAAVLYGLAKNNMQFLFPALGYSIAIILVGLINDVVNFIQLAWFAAI